MTRIHRLETLLSRIERLFVLRKRMGRPVHHLLIRTRKLSDAWLAERESHWSSN